MTNNKGLSVMKKMALRAAFVAVVMQAPAAFAGFIDETEATPVAPIASAAGMPGMVAVATAPAGALRLSASYQTALWDKAVPRQSGPVSLAKAIAILLPPDLPGVAMVPDPMMDSDQVGWGEGLTRRQALSQVIPAGWVLAFEDGRAQLVAAPVSVPVPVPALGLAAAAKTMNFVALQSDKTVRQAIVRWSKVAGWAFEDAYWDLPRDVPVVATAVFSSDFKESVLALLKTTEVTDLPAKPCFYTNKVVRAVGRSEKCDKTKE